MFLIVFAWSFINVHIHPSLLYKRTPSRSVLCLIHQPSYASIFTDRQDALPSPHRPRTAPRCLAWWDTPKLLMMRRSMRCWKAAHRRYLDQRCRQSSSSSSSVGAPRAAASAAAAAQQPQYEDPQTESGTWCRRAEEPREMEGWCQPIVDQVVSHPSPTANRPCRRIRLADCLNRDRDIATPPFS